jgi:hypothetical protein
LYDTNKELFEIIKSFIINKEIMSLITKKEIVELHDVNQENCISIFIPTHRAGKKVLQQEDSLALKNQLKEVKNKLAI